VTPSVPGRDLRSPIHLERCTPPGLQQSDRDVCVPLATREQAASRRSPSPVMAYRRPGQRHLQGRETVVRLVWLTDIHLNFLDREARGRFADEVAAAAIGASGGDHHRRYRRGR
jgi:hypothetical protein